MNHFLGVDVMIEAAAAAARNYADLVTDRDPDDGEHVVPGELRRFLARLRLLHGVPFSYLVPDAELLPKESIRFFYIDRSWTDAMVQGALSVGTISTADRAQLEASYPYIRSEVDETERSIRKSEDNGQKLLLQGPGGTITGFLLRSRLVSGWPNLHVRAYSRDILKDDVLTTEAESSPERMKVLRMERLAPAVLLVLFDGVPAVVHIEEPRQGIQFGVSLNRTDPPTARKAKVKARDNSTGEPLAPPGNSVDVPFRKNAPGVINVTELRKRLAKKTLKTGDTLEPNEFALQMLLFPYRQVFGDPENKEGLKYFDMDKFNATVSLVTLKAKIVAGMKKENP